jgi:hypothetical protein
MELIGFPIVLAIAAALQFYAAYRGSARGWLN